MKRMRLTPIILLLIIITSACKKDNDEPAPNPKLIVYDGASYFFMEGVIWDYGYGSYTPNHYTYAYFLPDEEVGRGEYAIPANDPPIALSFFLSAPDNETLKPATYEFVENFKDWGDEDLYEAYLSQIKGKYVITDLQLGFDENGDNLIDYNEFHEVTEGTVRFTGDYLEFDLILTNGKTVKGQSNATFHKSLPPA